VTHVINFDIPDNAETYIHRIGRTGRAEKTGNAITFIIPEKDAEYLADIEALMNREVPIQELPETLEISDVLTEDEMPKISIKEVEVKLVVPDESGPAFH